MFRPKIFSDSIFIVLCFSICKISYAQNKEPVWLTSVETPIVFGIKDKFDIKKDYIINYVVRSSTGSSFLAKKYSSEDYSRVTFPRDFVDMKTGEPGWHRSTGCLGEAYSWEIIVDDRLIDKGEFRCGRNKKQ